MKRTVIYLAMVVLTLVSCGRKGGNTSEQESSIPEKRVLKVETKTNLVPFSYPAQIRGKQDISIFPQVTGTLDAVYVSEGQNVKQGQRLFAINATSYQAAVDNAAAAVNVAKANVGTHELELNATKQLFEKGIVAEHQYKLDENALLVAQAQLAEAEAALKHARNDLSHTIVCSPHDGVVGTINYRQGSLVAPGIVEPLTIVSDNSTVYAYISLNADEYMELLREYGSKEELMKTIPEFDLILGNDIVYEHKGHLETMSGIIDQLTGAISARVAFPNPDGLLSAGASGTARIELEYDGITVPRSATYEIQDKHFVYLIERAADGTATANSTEVGVYRLNDSEYIITEGLTNGDEIAVEGVSRMTNGMQIVPKN